MHQTDTLFHKKTGSMGFVFGFDVDNHAINTVPKETLVRITKAEDGGLGGKGVWKPATTRLRAHGRQTPQNELYLDRGASHGLRSEPTWNRSTRQALCPRFTRPLGQWSRTIR